MNFGRIVRVLSLTLDARHGDYDTFEHCKAAAMLAFSTTVLQNV